ncbi:NmrA family transcriptional regulator [Spongiactinospora rosea]|uniref:NmrA family transcriptional regulator n=1 Tax=Spongiactinospora rosea TaxID=2248750 RepID=A0A366LSS9_9ACTN|nr:NAD(P)H-binding protein [Spongiactinospora rosea]RBQ16807.1 NmrA family transcriptional regulator [Spongiactinospora rosea]
MIMVSGASGQLGRRTVEHLLQRADAARVVALSRTPDAVADLGVATRYADFDAPDSLRAAFEGAERLLLISLGSLTGAPRGHVNAIEAAAKAGVGHVIYTSFTRAGEPGQPQALIRNHQETERLLTESGLTFTALRFNQWPEMWNLIGIPAMAVAGGVLPGNGGGGRVGHITRDDSAAVAAAVLAEGGCEGQLLEVTGPEAVGDADVADALAQVTGRPVRYEEVSDAELATILSGRGLPEMYVQGWTGLGSYKRDGWFDITTHAVERLTGRKPTPITDYFAAHPEALRTP